MKAAAAGWQQAIAKKGFIELEDILLSCAPWR